MQLIQLIHSEHQINNKNIDRKVLANAEIYNEVAEKQHRSRKHHQAGLLLLNKVLVGDLFRLTHFSGYYAMNDTKGCYDRIDHNFSILVLMFFGVPWVIARNLFRVIQQACHCIKTGCGVSCPVYGNEDENEPIAGICQGNGSGPSLWCLISTIIIKNCKRKGHGTTITTPISKKIVSVLGFAFFNDADLVTVVNNAYKSGAEMIQKMQALMTEWCGCIRTTGRLIAPAKTRWFLVFFSGMVTIGSTKQRTPYLVTSRSPTKMETYTPSIEKSQEQLLNLWAYKLTSPTPLLKRWMMLLFSVKNVPLK